MLAQRGRVPGLNSPSHLAYVVSGLPSGSPAVHRGAGHLGAVPARTEGADSAGGLVWLVNMRQAAALWAAAKLGLSGPWALPCVPPGVGLGSGVALKARVPRSIPIGYADTQGYRAFQRLGIGPLANRGLSALAFDSSPTRWASPIGSCLARSLWNCQCGPSSSRLGTRPLPARRWRSLATRGKL